MYEAKKNLKRIRLKHALAHTRMRTLALAHAHTPTHSDYNFTSFITASRHPQSYTVFHLLYHRPSQAFLPSSGTPLNLHIQPPFRCFLTIRFRQTDCTYLSVPHIYYIYGIHACMYVYTYRTIWYNRCQNIDSSPLTR